MSKVLLVQKEQHYASTETDAEEVVLAAKQSRYLTMHKITEKHNKLGTYYLVDLTYSYDTPREVMENERPDVDDEEDSKVEVETPAGQLDIFETTEEPPTEEIDVDFLDEDDLED